MKMPPPIATKFTKLVLTILAITNLGIILSFVSQDHKLNEHYQDKFSLYVYFNDELKSLDEWIRETDLSGSFYFGGTLDYHY